MKCNECNGHLYGCPYEDYDISECDEGKALTRMTELAYVKGREEAINELCKILETKQTGFNMVSMANVYHYAEQMKGEGNG